MSPAKLLRQRRGVTMVELLVCAALLAMLMGALAALMGPFSNVFLRLQSLNHAQSISDTLLDTLRGELLGAREYIKFYPEGETFTSAETGSEGAAVEFVNTDGYVVVVGAEGCEETDIIKNNKLSSTFGKREPGYLLMRYYRVLSGNIYHYEDETGRAIARGVSQVYGDRFYVGYKIKLAFEAGPEKDGRVSSVTATVQVYREGEAPAWEDSAVLDLAFSPALRTEGTAKRQEPETGGGA